MSGKATKKTKKTKTKDSEVKKTKKTGTKGNGAKKTKKTKTKDSEAKKTKQTKTKNNDPLYSAQEKACKKLFDKDRLKNAFYKDVKLAEKPKELEYKDGEIGEVYDITGLSAIEVIAVVTVIINDSDKWPTVSNKTEAVRTFYFLIKPKNNEDEAGKMFKLQANPTKNQPGNGAVCVMRFEVKRNKYCAQRFKSYKKIIEELVQAKTKPRKFAESIQKLFKDNRAIGQADAAIAETYFLLLFEIARRLSNEEGKEPEGERLDDLPIGSAIARIIKLLTAKCENEDEECLKKELESCCYCFQYKASDREKKIKELNKATTGTAKIPSLSFCEKELEEMYCKPPVDHLSLVERLCWKGSYKDLQKFVKECIKLEGTWSQKKGEGNTFKSDENRQLFINCKYDKTKKYWTLDFMGERGGEVKKIIIELVINDSDKCSLLKYLLLKQCVCWNDGFGNLEKFVKTIIKLKGTWSSQTFTSTGLTIDCKYDERKRYWTLTFKGTEGSAVEKTLIELGMNQMLTTKLLEKNLRPHNVKGDACFFRSVAHQILGSEGGHHKIRMAGIKYMKRNKDEFEELMREESFDHYISRMSRNSERCDNIIMKAVARAKNLVIHIIQPIRNDIVLNQPKKVVVGFVNEHYISVD